MSEWQSKRHTPREVLEHYNPHTGEGTVYFSHDPAVALELWHAFARALDRVEKLERALALAFTLEPQLTMHHALRPFAQAELDSADRDVAKPLSDADALLAVARACESLLERGGTHYPLANKRASDALAALPDHLKAALEADDE